MTTPTREQVQAGFEMMAAVAEAIRGLGTVPSGELYARSCMQHMSIETYNSVIGVLKRAELVSERNHLLTWTGPATLT